jgi:hypothetical protein
LIRFSQIGSPILPTPMHPMVSMHSLLDTRHHSQARPLISGLPEISSAPIEG